MTSGGGQRSRRADIVVVGGGPAGIGAALAAAERGARVVLVDEQPSVGGQLRYRVAPIAGIDWLDPELNGLPGVQLAAELAVRLEAAGVEVVSGVAWGLFQDDTRSATADGAAEYLHVLGILAGDDCYELRGRSVILATGSTDRVRPFPGWTLPGVLTARAAQIMLHVQRVLPGGRVAVIGSGEQAEEVANDLAQAGAQVVARVSDLAGLSVHGDGTVESIELDGEEHEVDAVVIALGRQPDPELALQARVELVYDAADGVHVPRRDARLQTSLPGLYVAGDAAGILSASESLGDGYLTGLTAAEADEATLAEARSHAPSPNVVRQSPLPFVQPADEVCVCRCEEVDTRAIRQAIAEGALTLNDVKRRTRAGMGLCQGISCLGTIAALLHAEAGVPLAEITPMTARPPARLIPLAKLAALETHEA